MQRVKRVPNNKATLWVNNPQYFSFLRSVLLLSSPFCLSLLCSIECPEEYWYPVGRSYRNQSRALLLWDFNFRLGLEKEEIIERSPKTDCYIFLKTFLSLFFHLVTVKLQLFEPGFQASLHQFQHPTPIPLPVYNSSIRASSHLPKLSLLLFRLCPYSDIISCIKTTDWGLVTYDTVPYLVCTSPRFNSQHCQN